MEKGRYKRNCYICCGISSWSSGSKHTVYEEDLTSGGFIISFNPAVRVRWSLKQLISRIYHLWKWLRGDFQLHVWWILRVFVVFFADCYRSRPSNDLPFEHESLNHSEIMYIRTCILVRIEISPANLICQFSI